ncbi:hypothetical protein RRG08_014554 [Elysia crispata]|uniref:Uncharacterized protein n=1 Tax=Elysia crispata TaxID=231223 RepID=A0AAE0XZD4_9GAST|nr:hypothetical protein RRG08_014554 [Elysia crispata]
MVIVSTQQPFPPHPSLSPSFTHTVSPHTRYRDVRLSTGFSPPLPDLHRLSGPDILLHKSARLAEILSSLQA